MKHPIHVVIPDIRSVHNVASVFRTADAAGVTKIHLAGYTPTPIDRFGRKRADFAKVALGAEETVPWEYAKDTAEVIKKLKAEGFTIVALEQAPGSVDYTNISPEGPMTLVLGNETEGIPKELLALADIVAEIPMEGTKESLNVSVAAGVMLFALKNAMKK